MPLLFFSYTERSIEYFGPLDLIFSPVCIILILVGGYFDSYKKAQNNPIYTYYIKGLFIKMLAAIFFCLFYIFYFGGGDTMAYFSGSYILIEMFLKRPLDFFVVYFGEQSWNERMLFNFDTNWPSYWDDKRAFFVTKLITPISLLGFQRFIPTTIIFSAILYLGIWRLFLTFAERYKHNTNAIAIIILYLPSVLFWSSGILKDSITFSALGWYIFSLNNIIKLKKVFLNILFMIISIFFILKVKPYIIYAIIPGSFVWIFYYQFVKLPSYIIKILIIPFIFVIALFVSEAIINNIDIEIMHEFSLNTVLIKAKVNQEDLVRSEEYGMNYFDIGTFEPTFTGILSKFPISVISCLFRPFIWEIKNFAMLLSGLENTIILFFSLIVVYKMGVLSIYKIVTNDPFLLFIISFVIIFAFGIGLSTPNFGALVRYRLPVIPLFFLFIVIIYYTKKELFN